MSCSIRQTYVERKPKEPVETRNLRAVFTASAWYREHLRASKPDKNSVDVLILTNGPFAARDEFLHSLELPVVSGLHSKKTSRFHNYSAYDIKWNF